MSIHELAVEIDNKDHLLISRSLGDDLAVGRGDKGPSPELKSLTSCRGFMTNTIDSADIAAVGSCMGTLG